MNRTACLAVAACLALGTTACAPITSYNGFQVQDVRPEQIKVGEDSRSTVLTKLGSPSVRASFDPNIWFYVTQISDNASTFTVTTPGGLLAGEFAVISDCADSLAMVITAAP